MNRTLLFIPLGVFIAMGVLFWIGLGQDNKSVLPSQLIGKPFPQFATTALESGKAVSNADINGQPALVNIWATWCPTCKAEHEFLNTLAKQGVRIVGVNYKDDDFKAKQWLSAYGNPYVFNLSDPEGKLGLDLGVYGAPETFLIDSQGIIRGKHVGDLNAQVWKKLQPQFAAMQ